MRSPRTAGEALARARAFLEKKGIDGARRDAELLVAHALGLDRLRLYLALDRPLDAREIARARALVQRRARREPVAYITGSRDFYGRPFAVDRSVLIPRPETELLVDVARARARATASTGIGRIADMGTGSGCVAVTLALEIEGAEVVASDVSPDALARARANAERLGARVRFVEGDGPEALAALAPFDLVVSNPPYVDPAERESLAPEVREFEPALALYAPRGDRDHWVGRLCGAAERLLARGGALLVELGAAQGESALAIARSNGLAARLHRDFGGVERVLEAERRAA